jgi:hypothetical protein
MIAAGEAIPPLCLRIFLSGTLAEAKGLVSTYQHSTIRHQHPFSTERRSVSSEFCVYSDASAVPLLPLAGVIGNLVIPNSQ